MKIIGYRKINKRVADGQHLSRSDVIMARLTKIGFAPLDVVTTIMVKAFKRGDEHVALEAARIALPYCHAKMATVVITAPGSDRIDPENISDAELVAILSERNNSTSGKRIAIPKKGAQVTH